MQKRLFLLIVLGLMVWGAFHAWGAYRLNHNPWRAVMVLACVGGFLGFWFLLLALRPPRRPQREFPAPLPRRPAPEDE